jgi:hypothetical protein
MREDTDTVTALIAKKCQFLVLSWLEARIADPAYPLRCRLDQCHIAQIQQMPFGTAQQA